MNAPLTWPASERVDAARLEAGVLYCPVCRRPTTAAGASITAAAHRLARHLDESHDPIFSALLRAYLRAPVDGASRPDPFYPTGASW